MINISFSAFAGTAILALCLATPVPADQPRDADRSASGRTALWLETFRGELESTDRELGDFEAVYSFSQRRKLRVGEAPPTESWTSPYIHREGRMTVRRRGADVTVSYDYSYTRTKEGVVSTPAPVSELFFFEGPTYIARLDGEMLTYEANSFMSFNVLPPLDTDCGYSYSPKGLFPPAANLERWTSNPASVRLVDGSPSDEEYVRESPAFSRRLGTGFHGSRIRHDGQTGRLGRLTHGVFLAYSDGTEGFFPTFDLEVAERRGGYASRLRWRSFDWGALDVLDSGSTVASCTTSLTEAGNEPDMDVDLTLLSMGPLGADVPVSIADYADRVGRLRHGDESSGWEWVNRYDQATGKWTREREFDRATGKWVQVAARK